MNRIKFVFLSMTRGVVLPRWNKYAADFIYLEELSFLLKNENKSSLYKVQRTIAIY